MATPKLSVHAVERSTYPITVSLVDHNKAAIVPNDDIVWSLVDESENIINERDRVEYTPPDSTLLIVLTDEDLQMMTTKDKEVRYLVVECTYDSTFGSGLSFRQEVQFTVDGLKRVT